MSIHSDFLTVGDLRDALAHYSRDQEIYLSGDIVGGATLWVGDTGEEIWWT